MTNFLKLETFGWDKFFENQFKEFSKEGYSAGRVAIENKRNYLLYTSFGELTGEISGKFHFDTDERSDFPAVGDWVLFRPILDEGKAIIEKVFERKSKLGRKAAGIKTDEQIIAANIDYAFIVSSLNQELNPGRLERYLTLISDNNIEAVLIFSKSDLCTDAEKKISEAGSFAGDTKLHIVSSFENEGIEELSKYFEGNKTIAVVGSSGVGKSTLINVLTGEDSMEVSEISLYKDKGRHTTSHRELILIESGGMIIDTPGMRELQLWEGSDGISETFSDVEKYLGKCRFSDCRHDTEPGCAIKNVIESGELDERRFKSYIKLQREIRHFENKSNIKAALAEKKKWKKVTAGAKKNDKRNR